MGTALKHMASAATQIVVEHIGETQAEPASTWALNLRTKAAQFKKASTKLAKWTTTGLKMGGNLSWAVGTSLMVLVVPVKRQAVTATAYCRRFDSEPRAQRPPFASCVDAWAYTYPRHARQGALTGPFLSCESTTSLYKPTCLSYPSRSRSEWHDKGLHNSRFLRQGDSISF